MKTLATELMDSLIKLDQDLAGLGLYSCCEVHSPGKKGHPFWKVEWEKAIKPRLLELGCVIENSLTFPRKTYAESIQGLHQSVRFMTPTASICDLKMVRISNIKVTRFGSGYQVNRAYEFDWRWCQLKMRNQIRQLWWPRRETAKSDIRLLLFMGFDRAPLPFRNEIIDLDKVLRWSDHQVEFDWKSWKDAYERDFRIFLGCWSYGSG